jgi:protein-S-isoprenylcysteine O-methyltransferase Ste14
VAIAATGLLIAHALVPVSLARRSGAIGTGPYRFNRNPMYASWVTRWVDWILLLADPVLTGLTGLLALGLNQTARLEETAWPLGSAKPRIRLNALSLRTEAASP